MRAAPTKTVAARANERVLRSEVVEVRAAARGLQQEAGPARDDG